MIGVFEVTPTIARISGLNKEYIVTFDTGLPRKGESLIIEGVQYQIIDIHRQVYKSNNGGYHNQSITILVK